MNSPFSIILWFYIAENTTNLVGLFRRYLSTDIYQRLLVLRDTNCNLKYSCSASICTPNTYTGSHYGFSSDKGIDNIWEIFVVSVDSTTFKFSITGSLNLIQTFPVPYSEDGFSFNARIGTILGVGAQSMKCFMYRFLILNSFADIETLYSSSSTSYSCIVPSCSSPCPTAFIFDSNKLCVASNSEVTMSGNNTLCSCASGCSNDISCLSPLNCNFNSTYFNGTNLYCLCGNTENSLSCSNPICFEECLYCTTYYSCSACKDPNSEPADSYGCKCKAKYFNTTILAGSYSNCMPCSSQCAACVSSSTCISCIDLNSYLNSSNLCECKSGYYQTNDVCTACNAICKMCVSASECVECADENSYLEGSTCICKDGFYLDTSCLPCLNTCQKCLSLDECISCLDPNSIIDNSICKCKEGFYLEDTASMCSPCNETCLSCSSNASCSSCKDKNSVISENSFCECKPGYKEKTGTNGFELCEYHPLKCKSDE